MRSLSILCFYTIPQWWDGDLPPGTAGSEEAVVEVARRLANRGWYVKVYNNCGSRRHVSDRLHYIPLNLYKSPESDASITLVWRDPNLCLRVHCAQKMYLWLQDTVEPARLTSEVLRRVTKIIVLSPYHRALYAGIPNTKFLLVGNGIDTSRLNSVSTTREYHSCIYTSSPERGLKCLLSLWPHIRTSIPDATLKVFYGWDTWDNIFGHDRNRRKEKEVLQDLLACLPGIRVRCEHLAPDELWAEYLSADVWLYPTEWDETSCISAMKAQACGALPVTTNRGALATTVKWGIRIDEPNIYSNYDAQLSLVEAMVSWMTTPDEQFRRSMMESAAALFDWERVIDEWEAEFSLRTAL